MLPGAPCRGSGASRRARTWLLVIARRTALRVSRRHVRHSELDRHLPGPPVAPDPEGWTELGSLIDELDEDRRLAIVLTQILGLSYADAAEVSGCAVGTIRSRVARAREELLALRGASDLRVRRHPTARPATPTLPAHKTAT